MGYHLRAETRTRRSLVVPDIGNLAGKGVIPDNGGIPELRAIVQLERPRRL